jgi:ribonuclease HII
MSWNQSWKEIERNYFKQGKNILIGIDEAGCGCLAGVAVVAACFIPEDVPISGIRDSKKLKRHQREAIFTKLTSDTRIQYKIVVVSPQRIDEINILQARLEGFVNSGCQLLLDLTKQGKLTNWNQLCFLLDGDKTPKAFIDNHYPTEAIVKGDDKCICIGAASILAKVTRDRIMTELHNVHPQYGFDQHFGYPTPLHYQKLSELGPIDGIHRKSYRLVPKNKNIVT